MITSMSGQAQLFVMTVGIGFLIGFVFDGFRIVRKIFPHPNFLTQIEDVLYWLFVTLIMFYFMLNRNYGEIRFFSIVGAFLGMSLYFLTLSFLIMKTSFFVIDFIKKVLTATFRILLFPIRLIGRLLSIPLGFFGFMANKITLRSKKVLKKSSKYAKMKTGRFLKECKIILKKV